MEINRNFPTYYWGQEGMFSLLIGFDHGLVRIIEMNTDFLLVNLWRYWLISEGAPAVKYKKNPTAFSLQWDFFVLWGDTALSKNIDNLAWSEIVKLNHKAYERRFLTLYLAIPIF